MAIKKSKKTEPVIEEVSLQKIAEEMNNVMKYGFNEETGETDESEQIDIELDDEALQKELLRLAEEDLQHADEEHFTPEVWEWFINNGITPTGGEVAEVADDAGEVADVEDDGGEAEVAEEENVPAKKPAKEKGQDVKEKPLKKQTAPEKRVPKERGPSNEQIAIDAVKEGKTEKDLLKVYTKIYEARGKDDPDYISQRTTIYYNIALKALGKTPAKKEKPAKEAPAKKEKAKEEAVEDAPKAKPKLKKK